MRFQLNSGLFNVCGPDGCWVFDSLRERIEEWANERHEDDRRTVDDHPVLFDDMKGRLTVPDPDWRPGAYEIDYGTFVRILAELWVDMFNDSLGEAGIEAKATCTGKWSPKEYNFRGDQADFDFDISESEASRLFALCLADDRFAGWLSQIYSSRDGFWSFCADNVAEFSENIRMEHGEEEYERSVWQAVNFLLFPDGEASGAWNNSFVERAYDLDFDEALYFVAAEEEEEEAI
jgi:hypothetical protein